MYEDIDFSIDAVQHVIERLPDPRWEMDGILSRDLYILGIALKGKATYAINSHIYTVEEGGLILVPPEAHRTARSFPEDPWHFITIGCQLHFSSPDARSIFEKLPQYFPVVSNSIRKKARDLARIWNGGSPYRSLLAKGLIYEIFYELISEWDRRQSVSASYERILKARAYIQEHYSSELRQEDLAQMCGYSGSHFRRLFSSFMGMSCSQYILHVRIDVAKNLLLSGTATVSEAAMLTGFSDVYHFSKMFKKVTGSPPSHYKA